MCPSSRGACRPEPSAVASASPCIWTSLKEGSATTRSVCRSASGHGAGWRGWCSARWSPATSSGL
eukprot:6893475-Alexandrium_andersonii.AAC.1